MLKTRFQNYPKGKPFSAILGDFLGRGIFNVDGESWSFQKNMATLELTKHSVRSFAFEVVKFDIHHRLVPFLMKKAKDGAVLDLQDVFKRFSFDSICRFSFGLDPMCLELSLPMSEFALAFDVASKVSAERAMAVSPIVWKMKRLLNLGSEKKLREAVRMIDVLAKEVIRQKRKNGVFVSQGLVTRSVSDETYLKDININ
ncbi:hypothetical protein Fmac_029929 [Flemingia macrophylla]|uniref:Cytochrome P450 n=1 Tax=Flemingia macrophylla TaxID=520843 RepID=A0ABD1LDC5_9FABA